MTLASLGADLNLTDPDGATALVIAIINANYDVAAALLEKGADPNIGDNEARMAALYAAVDMHRLAIGHGRPNPKPSGRARCCRSDQGAARRMAPIRMRGWRRRSSSGITRPAIARSAKARRRSCAQPSRATSTVMRMLLAAGADPKLTQPNQANALMLAAGLGWRDGSPAAPSYDQGSREGRDRGDQAVHGVRPRHQRRPRQRRDGAARRHHGRGASEPIVRFLVEHGADLNAKNKQGRTPLEVAVASRKDVSNIVDYLKTKTERTRQFQVPGSGFQFVFKFEFKVRGSRFEVRGGHCKAAASHVGRRTGTTYEPGTWNPEPGTASALSSFYSPLLSSA